MDIVQTVVILGGSLVGALAISWKLTAGVLPMVAIVVTMGVLVRNSSKMRHKKGVELLDKSGKVPDWLF